MKNSERKSEPKRTRNTTSLKVLIKKIIKLLKRRRSSQFIQMNKMRLLPTQQNLKMLPIQKPLKRKMTATRQNLNQKRTVKRMMMMLESKKTLPNLKKLLRKMNRRKIKSLKRTAKKTQKKMNQRSPRNRKTISKMKMMKLRI